MDTKRLLAVVLLILACLGVSVGLVAAAPSAITTWCDADPVGNAACASNVDKPAWLNPGYRWHVFFDTFGSNLCMQISANGGTSWTQNTCTFVGDNSIYEDCGDNNSGNGNCRNDHWICQTGNNIVSTNNIMFQFYRDSGACDTDFSGASEWSSQPTFSTGPSAVSLTSLAAQSATGLPPGVALAAVALVGLSGLAVSTVWRRR